MQRHADTYLCFSNLARRSGLRTAAVLIALTLVGVRAVDAQPGVNVTTYHYDSARTGQNLAEGRLTPFNVNPVTFGKLFSYPVDGFVYAQPLYLSAVTLADGSVHNLVYVATEHDSVFAFDADGGGQLWKRSFINPAAGITTIPFNEVGSTDIVPEIGITATPAIDPGVNGILYVLVKTKEVRGTPTDPENHYVQRLHALDVTTGADMILANGKLVQDTLFKNNQYVHMLHGANPDDPCVPGIGDGSQGGQVCFNALRQLVRPGLALANGVLYLASASHGDNGPYHGWVLDYDPTTLQLLGTFNTTRNGGLGGIWESGDAPAIDAQGNLYVVTGNGTFRREAVETNNMYGDSVIKLTANLDVADFFTPFNQAALNSADADQGSGGIMLLPDQPGSHPHLLVQTGKTGKIYLLDRDDMGKYRDGPGCNQEPILLTCDRAYQFLPNAIGGSFDTPAYFTDGTNQYVYYGGVGDTIKAFTLDFDPDRNGMVLDQVPAFRTNVSFGFTGVTPTVTADGTANGIVWGLDVRGYGIPANPFPSPMILYAFNAADLTTLYASNMIGQRDQMGSAVKFNTPTVANGKVYVGTQTTLDVFGQFEAAVGPPVPPSNLSASSGPPAPAPPSIKLSWDNNATNATGVKIERSTDGTIFALLTTVNRNVDDFTDTAVQASTRYFYQVKATNQVGDSAPSNTANAKTHIAAPVLLVDDIFDMKIRLTWTATADDHYEIGRSPTGNPSSFVNVGTVLVPATTFTDTPGFGTFFYQVTAFSAGPDSAVSNIMSATVGPVSVDHPTGFMGAKDLTLNGFAKYTGTGGSVLELTDGGFGEAGSAFTNSPAGIRSFTTSFTYKAVPGMTSQMADGLTFIIQGNSPMSLGFSGGGLAFQNVPKSVAIKFDLFNHGRGGTSTGLYFDGHTPDIPGFGESEISLVGTAIDLTSGHPFKITLTYDGTRLIETIMDTVTGASLIIDDYPPVDIAAHVGSDAGFVGFGGGTGGLTSVQDISSWTFTPNEAGLPPRKPGNPTITNIQQVGTTFNVSLAWKANNAFTATKFKIERSPDNSTFTEINQVDVSQTTYTDMNLTAGQYFYRLRSFDGTLNSAYTGVACVPVGGATVNHAAGFACHGDLTSNGNAFFTGSLGRLTDGGFGEAGSIFTNNKVDITKFHSTFTFQIHTPGTSLFADGMAFVVQSNSPTALDGAGGGLGYGSDTPGGPRGIRNSIAIKFDIFQNTTETDNATGLFSDGRSPTVEDAGSGDRNVPIDKGILDLKSQHVFKVELAYDGTTLTEKITDMLTNSAFTVTPPYTVDIPAKVGGNTAFVGFTGATGGLTATQDVQTWTLFSP